MEQVIIKSIKDIDPYLDQLKEIKIWICHSGCGKTYLSEIDDRFFDLDRYRLRLCKLNTEAPINKVISKMWETINSDHIVINNCSTAFLAYLKENNLPFVYLYEKPSLKAGWVRRMRHRGDSKKAIRRSKLGLQYYLKADENRAAFKIGMNSKEFLSDYVWQVFGMPEKYIQTHAFNSEQYKMLFIDTDCLVNFKNKITKYTRKVIKAVKSKVKIVLMSESGFNSIKPILKQLDLNSPDEIVICYSGGVISRGNGEVLEGHSITKSDIEIFLHKIDETNLINCYLMTVNKKYHIKKIKDMNQFITENKIYKISLAPPNDGVKKLAKSLAPEIIEHFEVICYKDNLEFVSKGVGKAKAVQAVSNLNKLQPKKLITVGRWEGKDMNLSKIADCRVAVCNADDEIKQAAQYITDSSNDDGVAKALKKIFL